jgi:heme/copper-type cytochrome/quinol oxidase subunit 2
MRVLIKAIPYIIIAVLLCAVVLQQVHIKSLKKHNNEQSLVIKAQATTIDELLKRKTYNFQFDCQLHVRDQSKITLYGRNNSGTMTVPAIRTYELKIDSTNFIMSVKAPDD